MVWDYDEPLFRDYTVSGQGLESRGFVGGNTVDYVGLLLNGLMWKETSIWSPEPGDAVTSTIWTSANPSVSTTWIDATPSVSTTWTAFYYQDTFY
jgi:hypothetical protein